MNGINTPEQFDLDLLAQVPSAVKHLDDMAREIEKVDPRLHSWIVSSIEILTGLNLTGIVPVVVEQIVEQTKDQPEAQIPEQPLKEITRKSHSKRTLRERGHYQLADFSSIRELGEMSEMSTGKVKEVLLQKKLITRVQRNSREPRCKYVLTDLGWSYGMMYDPCDNTFHDKDSDKIMTTNAQPVFNDDVLRFF